jgi:hypothetical protein
MEMNNKPVPELHIRPATGKKYSLLAGRDEVELRWVAARLRKALALPRGGGPASTSEE